MMPKSSKSQRAPRRKSRLKVFISHAAQDKKLAEALIRLIEKALKLPPQSIRCTSVDGYRLPGGADTDKELKRETLQSVAFVGVVSTASLQSMYVLFELGARWGANKRLIPLVTKDIPMSRLNGSPLSGLNALRVDNASQLHQFIKELAAQLRLRPQSGTVYEQALRAVTRVRGAKVSVASASAPTGSVNKEAVRGGELVLRPTISTASGTARIDSRQLPSADVVVDNPGEPFALFAVAKLLTVHGADPTDDRWEYESRVVKGGGGKSWYHIATVETTRTDSATEWLVKLRGERMMVVRRWQGRGPLFFDVEWTLSAEVRATLYKFATVLIRVKLDPERLSFSVEKVREDVKQSVQLR
jgi:hypothetical protein